MKFEKDLKGRTHSAGATPGSRYLLWGQKYLGSWNSSAI
jgi:hypothetical protein